MSLTRWTTHPEAAAVIDELMDAAALQSDALRQFEERLLVLTSTHLSDWLDHISVTPDVQRLHETGFALRDVTSGQRVWHHPQALLPAIVEKENGDSITLGIRVESIEAVARANGLLDVVGSQCSPYRSVELFDDRGLRLLAVERHSWTVGTTADDLDSGSRGAREEAYRIWRDRSRNTELEETLQLARQLVDLAGADLAGVCALNAEREYWQSRNHAAQMQYERQSQLGLGWGNHDHFTFRSSRTHFASLLEILRTFGFVQREVFHAGAEAGWGAQVLEHPASGYVTFTDVDLSADELEVDFSRPLAERDELGTVGLWCELHGESIQEAGLHHLASRYDFERLRIDLPVNHLKPFSELPYLHQAFTEPEAWKVQPQTLDQLLDRDAINLETRDRFAEHGAAGSHLENIARGEGYKGFNQKNVSETMRATDPRTLNAGA